MYPIFFMHFEAQFFPSKLSVSLIVLKSHRFICYFYKIY